LEVEEVVEMGQQEIMVGLEEEGVSNQLQEVGQYPLGMSQFTYMEIKVEMEQV